MSVYATRVLEGAAFATVMLLITLSPAVFAG